MVYKSKKKTKDGRQYFFRVKYKNIYDEWIDYTSKKYASKKEATDEEALYKAKTMQQDMSVSNITFKKAYNEYRINHAKSVKKQTILRDNALFNNLKPIHDEKINDFSLNKYNKLLNYIEDKHFVTAYCNRILQFLKRIIIYSNKYYNTSDKIMKFIEPFKNVNNQKKEMDFYTLDEFKIFISVIDNEDHALFFSILYYMGLRVGELQALTWNDIKNNEIHITKTLTTKIKGEIYTISTPKTKNSIRTLPIPKNLIDVLNKLKLKEKQNNSFKENWFVFGGSLPYRETTITKYKNAYCKRANLKQIRIHDFRHSCASLLINKGATITLVSKYLGHSNVSITLNVYSHFYKNELNEITEMIGNL